MTYTYLISTNTKNSKLEAQSLTNEIKNSSIIKELNYIESNGDSLALHFKAELTIEEKTVLDSLVNSHEGNPISEEVIPTDVKIVESTENFPFSSKVLSDGRKLFRRKHGVQKTILANNNDILRVVVPYTECKVNKIELTNCKNGDTVDFKVYDNEIGTIQQAMGVPAEAITPNLMLNQFGYNVNVCDGMYNDESNYDADLVQGMIVEIHYFNKNNEDRIIGMTVTLHELV